MKTFRVTEAAVRAHYDILDKIGCLGPSLASGYLRAAYSDEETAAMRHIEKSAVALGAKAAWDKIGNLALSWPGSAPEYVEAASHLDTVPSGGNFDGAAGVVCGLLAIQSILESKAPRAAGLRLRVWRCEESSTFNSLYTGSLGAFGKLPVKYLANKFQGRTLEEAMHSQGADPDYIRAGKATISQEEIDSIRAHLELHIEQGNLLEVRGVDIGVVTSIRAPRRTRIILKGEFDHSGATPMGVEYRRDVNLAIAHILTRLDDLCTTELKKGTDLVQTVGVINSSRDTNEKLPAVYENAVPKVSGFGYFCLDVRSSSAATLEEYSTRAETLIDETAAELRVEATIEPISASAPLEKIDGKIQAAFEDAAKDLGVSSMRMPSGAGHDAAIVGAQKRSDGSLVPAGMVFIPCRGGKSHAPEEFATDAQIAIGASVLAGAMYRLVEK